MSRKTTLALVVFVALLGLVYYLQTRPEKGERTGERPRPVAKLTAEQVRKVTVTAKGQEVVLERRGEDWRITRPVDDDADSQAAKTMVDKLTGLEFGDLVTARKDRHKEHGVDEKSAIHVRVSDGKKTVADFYLGKVKDGFTMLRAAGQDQVHQAVGTLTYVFEREPKNWRDRTVVQVKQQDARRIEVTTAGIPGAGAIVLTRPGEKSDWKVESASPPVDRLDKATVSSLLSTLGNLAAFDFDDKASPAEAGLDSPTAKISVGLKDGKVQTLVVGKRQGDDYRIQRQGDPQVYIVKKYAVDALLRRPIDFRDKSVLTFKPADVESLRIEQIGPDKKRDSVTLTRKGEDWLGDGKKVADTSKIKGALETLSTLRAEGFARHSAEELGLDQPGWIVELRLKDRTRARLKVGSVEKEGVYGLTRDGSDEIYTFRKFTLDRFLLEPKSYK